MRRLVAIAVAGAVVASSTAAAGSVCPAMRASALKDCCCSASQPEADRLTCCTQSEDARASASAREHTERVQLPPPLVAVVLVYENGDRSSAMTIHARELLASAAGPPPVPLRI